MKKVSIYFEHLNTISLVWVGGDERGGGLNKKKLVIKERFEIVEDVKIKRFCCCITCVFRKTPNKSHQPLCTFRPKWLVRFVWRVMSIFFFNFSPFIGAVFKIDLHHPHKSLSASQNKFI